jgi:hypothetical protein
MIRLSGPAGADLVTGDTGQNILSCAGFGTP